MKNLITTLLLILGSCISLRALAVGNCGTPKASHTYTYIMVYDTKAAAYARSNYGTLEKHAQAGIDKCNQVVSNSNIDCYFKLAECMELPDLTWTDASSAGMMSAGPKISERDDVHQRWIDSGATICAVVVYPGGNTLSGNFVQSPMTWDACRGVIDASALSTGYTLIHETGHVFGCCHDDVFTNDEHPYALGYVGPKYYTVMSYGHMGQGLQLVPYFSGPDQVYNGVTLGDEHHNCARMFREWLPLIDKLAQRQSFIIVKEQAETAQGTVESEIPNLTKELGTERTTFGLSITSPDFLTFTSSSSWIHPSTSVSGNSFTTTVYVDVDANTTGATREGTVRIASTTDPTNVVEVKVRQIVQGGGGGGTVTPDGKVLVESVSLSPREISIPVGSTYQLKATVAPANATKPQLYWTTGSDLVATVSQSGLVTAKAEGEVFISVETTDGSYLGDYVLVTVTKAGTKPVDPGTGGGGNGGGTTEPEGTTDGKTYTIRLADTSPALYLTTTLVNEGQGSNKTYGLSTTAEGFSLVADSKGGYYIKSVDTEAYVGVNPSVAWDCANQATLWSIANIDGTTTTILQDANRGKGLGCDDAKDGEGVFTDKHSGNSKHYTWIVEEQAPVAPTLDPCATPVIALADGLITISCATADATIDYSLTAQSFTLSGTGTPDFSQLGNQQYVLTASAKANGYTDSESATLTFALKDIFASIVRLGDMNTDGRFTIEDVVRLVKVVQEAK